MTEEEEVDRCTQILKGVFQRLNISWEPSKASPIEVLKVKFILNNVMSYKPYITIFGETQLIEILRAIADMIDLSQTELKD